MHDPGNGWPEYRRFVVTELKRIAAIERDVKHIRLDMAVLRTKMYVASATAALFFSGLLTAIFHVLWSD